MAKYKVKMSCGHVETVELFGKTADRDRKIAWLEEHGECSACYKARIKAEKAAKTAAAAEKAAEENLPELTGSEKQVNWAITIRAQKLADLDKMAASNTTADDAQRRRNEIACKAARNVLANKTDSRFWIDNRNVEARKLIAANNLQAELKAEFDRLTAEATEVQKVVEVVEADVEDYVVTQEAQEVAVESEIELANKATEVDKARYEACVTSAPGNMQIIEQYDSADKAFNLCQNFISGGFAAGTAKVVLHTSTGNKTIYHYKAGQVLVDNLNCAPSGDTIAVAIAEEKAAKRAAEEKAAKVAEYFGVTPVTFPYNDLDERVTGELDPDDVRQAILDFAKTQEIIGKSLDEDIKRAVAEKILPQDKFIDCVKHNVRRYLNPRLVKIRDMIACTFPDNMPFAENLEEKNRAVNEKLDKFLAIAQAG